MDKLRSKQIDKGWLQPFDVLLLLVLLTAGMTSNTATIIVVVFLSISFFWKTATSIVASMLFFYPFYNIFKFNGVGVSYYNILIATATVCLMLKPDTDQKTLSTLTIRVKKNVVWLLIFCGYAIFVSFINSQASSIISVFLDLFIPLLFVGTVVNRKDIQLSSAIYAFSLGVICAGAVGSGLLPVKNLDAYVYTNAYRLNGVRLVRLQGVTVNPNYFSTDINLAIAGILTLPQISQRKMKHTEKILFVLLAICGIMSLSKSFFVGLFATFCFLPLFSGNLKKFAGIIGGTLAVGIILVIFYTQENPYILALLDRFTVDADSLDSLTSSRSTIWLNYLKYIFVDNPLSIVFGNGISADIPETIGQASHSLYIETIFHLGIIGVLLLLVYLFSCVSKANRKAIQHLPLLVFLVRAFAINLLLREAFMIDMIIILLMLNCQVYEKGKE